MIAALGVLPPDMRVECLGCKFLGGPVVIMSDSAGIRTSVGQRVASEHWKQAVVDHVDQYSRALFVTANRILNDPPEAEDICQRAYVKALDAESQVQSVAVLHAWLTRVVINQSLDVLRRRQVERRVLRERAQREELAPDASQRLEDREFVVGLLDQLDERTRSVVMMRTVQGLSGKEVTQRMGCSAALVSRLLHDGLMRMRLLARDGVPTEVGQ